jgi:hypothetical protein
MVSPIPEAPPVMKTTAPLRLGYRADDKASSLIDVNRALATTRQSFLTPVRGVGEPRIEFPQRQATLRDLPGEASR